jgi:hypothetical protein
VIFLFTAVKLSHFGLCAGSAAVKLTVSQCAELNCSWNTVFRRTLIFVALVALIFIILGLTSCSSLLKIVKVQMLLLDFLVDCLLYQQLFATNLVSFISKPFAIQHVKCYVICTQLLGSNLTCNYFMCICHSSSFICSYESVCAANMALFC